MIRTKISAVTSVTYGLLSALIIVAIIGGLSAAGVGVKNVFSAAGNGIAANANNSTSTPVTSTPTPNPIGVPNSALEAYQQSQITNAAAEIAAGTASVACLQSMNNNAASMASNNATCLGPGEGIAPPALPVQIVNGTEAIQTDGLIYAEVWNGDGSFSATSATLPAGSNSIILYNDGQALSGSNFYQERVTQCQTGNFGGYSNSPGTPTVIDGNEIVCAGITAIPIQNGSNGSNQSATAPLGYLTPW